MQPIKVIRQVINITDYKEIERVAQHHFKLPPISERGGYSFVAVEECGNDTDHSFHVDGGVDEDDDEEDISLIREGKVVPTYRNLLLLNLLCKDGVIAPGNYLVKVSW